MPSLNLADELRQLRDLIDDLQQRLDSLVGDDADGAACLVVRVKTDSFGNAYAACEIVEIGGDEVPGQPATVTGTATDLIVFIAGPAATAGTLLVAVAPEGKWIAQHG